MGTIIADPGGCALPLTPHTITAIRTVDILSLGAGVQSSTLALMAAHGEVTPMPVAAIFADTQAEPGAVYEWLNWLAPRLPFPIRSVTKGDLERDILDTLRGKRKRTAQPPLFVRGDKPNPGRLWRQCTQEYKLEPIRREARRIMQEAGAKCVHQWIGISMDEAHRMRDSDVRYVENVYPLVERGITRQDCLQWMEQHKYPRPPKSACVWCPMASQERWRGIRANPQDWDRAVKFDTALREKPGTSLGNGRIHGSLYVHRSGESLMTTDLGMNPNQGDLFGEDCTGLCGN